MIRATGNSLVGEAIYCCPGERDPATTVSKQQGVTRLRWGLRYIPLIRAAGVAEAGFDALIEYAQAEGQEPGCLGQIGVLDDVGTDLANSGCELRAPGSVWRPGPDAIQLTPQVGERLVEIFKALRNCRPGNFELEQRARLRVQSVPPPASYTA